MSLQSNFVQLEKRAPILITEKDVTTQNFLKPDLYSPNDTQSLENEDVNSKDLFRKKQTSTVPISSLLKEKVLDFVVQKRKHILKTLFHYKRMNSLIPESLYKSAPKPIVNIGNTCFLNFLLQLYFNTPELFKHILWAHVQSL